MRLGEGLIFQPGGEKRAKRRGKSAALVAKRRVKRVSIVFRYYFILSPPPAPSKLRWVDLSEELDLFFLKLYSFSFIRFERSI